MNFMMFLNNITIFDKIIHRYHNIKTFFIIYLGIIYFACAVSKWCIISKYCLFIFLSASLAATSLVAPVIVIVPPLKKKCFFQIPKKLRL